jgi:5'-nucleotidase
MTKPEEPKLVIALSSTALFDMSESHSIYENQGVEAYADYQRAHEDDVLEPGEAFPLVTKLSQG